MNLTPNVMAYWVIIFCTIYIVEVFELMQKFSIDDKSVAIGFVLGGLLMKYAPNPKETPKKMDDKGLKK